MHHSGSRRIGVLGATQDEAARGGIAAHTRARSGVGMLRAVVGHVVGIDRTRRGGLGHRLPPQREIRCCLRSCQYACSLPVQCVPHRH
jgi:hypothetical protein